VRAGAQIYGTLRKLLADAGFATGLGDEGGFAPDITAPEDVLRILVSAITDAGYTPDRHGVASQWIQLPASSIPTARITLRDNRIRAPI
jgi:enolase